MLVWNGVGMSYFKACVLKSFDVVVPDINYA